MVNKARQKETRRKYSFFRALRYVLNTTLVLFLNFLAIGAGASEYQICKALSLSVDANTTVTDLLLNIPETDKNDIFESYTNPIIFELEYFSDSVRGDYLQAQERLEELLKETQKLQGPIETRQPPEKQEKVERVTQTEYSQEAKAAFKTFLNAHFALLKDRAANPFGIELSVGAQCAGYLKFTFHKIDGNWEVFEKQHVVSGYPCHYPKKVCAEKYHKSLLLNAVTSEK